MPWRFIVAYLIFCLILNTKSSEMLSKFSYLTQWTQEKFKKNNEDNEVKN